MTKFRNNEYYESIKDPLYYPSNKVPLKKRDNEWFKKYSEAIWYDYIQGNLSTSYSRRSEMIENRSYGEGIQSTDKYKKSFYDWTNDEHEKKGYATLNWKIMPIIPKFEMIYLGLMSRIRDKVMISAIDPVSLSKKTKKKNKIWLEKLFKKEFDFIENSLGIVNNEQKIIPDTKEQLEMFNSLDGFKLIVETAMEAAIDHTFKISDWENDVYLKFHKDLFENHMAGTKTYTDPYTLKVKTRYVDIINAIVSFSEDKEGNNTPIAGELRSEYIYEIKKEVRKEIDKGVYDESIFSQLANHYNGNFGNPNINLTELTGDRYNSNGNYSYDKLRCHIVDLEFIEDVYEYYDSVKKGENEYLMYKEKQKKKKDQVQHCYQVTHKVTWVVGTDIVYKYGIVENTPRDKNNRPYTTYCFKRIKGESPVGKSKLNADQVQMANLKIQNLISMAAPPGIAVDWSILQNVNFGEGEVKPLELFKIRKQTGDFIYKLTTHRGHQNVTGVGKPFQEIQGGIGNALNEYINIMEFNVNKIRENIGINQISDASNPNPEQSVGGSKIALMSTNNALRMLYYAGKYLKEKTGERIHLKIKDLLLYSDEGKKHYIGVLGEKGINAYKMLEDLRYTDLSLHLEALPTDEEIEKIDQAVLMAMKPSESGPPTLSMSDYFFIQRLKQSENYKFIQAYLSYKENEKEKLTIVKTRQLKADDAKVSVAAKKAEEEKEINTMNRESILKREEITHETNEEIRKDKELAGIKNSENTKEKTQSEIVV